MRPPKPSFAKVALMTTLFAVLTPRLAAGQAVDPPTNVVGSGQRTNTQYQVGRTTHRTAGVAVFAEFLQW